MPIYFIFDIHLGLCIRLGLIYLHYKQGRPSPWKCPGACSKISVKWSRFSLWPAMIKRINPKEFNFDFQQSEKHNSWLRAFLSSSSSKWFCQDKIFEQLHCKVLNFKGNIKMMTAFNLTSRSRFSRSCLQIKMAQDLVQISNFYSKIYFSFLIQKS